MGSSDNFCLRWNDFESNISTSFRELREDSEFFDVSLCCDNGTDVVPAHKVILAACSPLFRKILARQKNQQNPFLYLKGIHLKELQAVLNFMYHGEVNVAQDSLNNFLAVAEELAVKGLTTDGRPTSDTPSGTPSSKKAVPKRKPAPVTPVSAPSSAAKKPKVNLDDDLDDAVDIKSIKAEPEPSGSGSASGPPGGGAASMVEADMDESYGGDGDDNGDFGAGEDFEGFDQYGEGNDFDDSMSGAAGGSAGATADGKGYGGFRPSSPRNFIDEQGYGYRRDGKDKKSGRTYWRCLYHKNFNCKARGRSIDGVFSFMSKTFHNHAPDEVLRPLQPSDQN